jgi:hypothetical protein
MEPESSLPYSQQLTNYSYREADYFFPRPMILAF